MQTDSGKRPFKLRPGRFLKLVIFLLVLALLVILAGKYLNFGGPEMPPPPSLRITGIRFLGWLEQGTFPKTELRASTLNFVLQTVLPRDYRTKTCCESFCKSLISIFWA